MACIARIFFSICSFFSIARVSDIAAARLVAPAHRKQLADLGQREPATLRMLDEVDAPG
jgi:hypothetical protein